MAGGVRLGRDREGSGGIGREGKDCSRITVDIGLISKWTNESEIPAFGFVGQEPGFSLFALGSLRICRSETERETERKTERKTERAGQTETERRRMESPRTPHLSFGG